MHRSPFLNRAVALGVVLLGLSRAAHAAPSLVVGVRQSGPAEKAADVQDLEEGIPKQFASGLESAGYAVDLVNDATIIGRIRDCASDDCLLNTTASGPTKLVAQVSVEIRRSPKRGRDYSLFVVVARTSPDRQVWREKHACRSCAVDAAKHLAFLIGAQLAAEVSKGAPAAEPTAAVAVVPPPAPPPPASPVVAASSGLAARVSTPAPVAESRALRAPGFVPWVGLGVGAAAIAGGFYLRHLDDKPTCELAGDRRRCPERYDTGKGGTILLVTGGLVALASIISSYVVEPSAESHTAVSFSPAGINVSGAF